MRCIFDLLSHPYQLQSIVIVQVLRTFFEKNTYNSIKFWDCPSNTKWIHHLVVDKETKRYNLKPIFICKSLWDFSMKDKCNLIIWNFFWKRISAVYVAFVLSNQDNISFMSVEGITIIGIPIGSLLVFSLSLILEHFLPWRNHLIAVFSSVISLLWCIFCFHFYSFSSFSLSI